MYSPKAPELEVDESGGEPLEGSGFELEYPESGFASDEGIAQKGDAQ